MINSIDFSSEEFREEFGSDRGINGIVDVYAPNNYPYLHDFYVLMEHFDEEHLNDNPLGANFFIKDFDFRISPSIIARGECEMLGLSFPRFAIRASTEELGIINLRRYKQMKSAFEGKQWQEWSPDHDLDQSKIIPRSPEKAKEIPNIGYLPEYVSRQFEHDSCIADCLLIPPDRLTCDYHIITADLWAAYGESAFHSFPIGKNPFPFVKHTGLGGGLCSQACCFMTMSLLHRYTHGIYGIPEITQIVAEIKKKAVSVNPSPAPETEKELLFEGMTTEEMGTFFDRVGLHALDESLDFLDDALYEAEEESFDEDFVKMLYSQAIRSYVLSGVPVILPVDDAILNPDINVSDEERPHGVIINGVNRDFAERKFVIADPSRNPFRLTDIDEIFRAKIQVDRDKSCADFALHIIPVVPDKIRLPFLSLVAGIFRDCCSLDENYYPRSNPIAFRERLETSEFRLVKLDSKEVLSFLEGADYPLRVYSDNKRCFLHNLNVQPLQSHLNQWCWIEWKRGTHYQELRHSVRIHNAQGDKRLFHTQEKTNFNQGNPFKITLPDGESDTEYLDFIDLSFHGENTDNDIDQNAQDLMEGDDGNKPAPLKLGILTSFNLFDLGQTIEVIKENGISVCELYTFMQSTVDDIRKESSQKKCLQLPEGKTALEFLAQCNHRSEDTVDYITDFVQNAIGDSGIKVISFASFFPELSYHPDDQHGHAALTRSAILFLAKLAKALEKHGHDVSTIELVAGSKMQGLCVAEMGSRPVIAAKRVTSLQAINNIIDNLVFVLRDIENDKKNCKSVNFAFEVEPGPLFAINSLQSIRDFCDTLDEKQTNNRPLLKKVGINLDIAHWNIALNNDQTMSQFIVDGNFSLSKLERETSIFSRISNAHISGYHVAAHFGDLVLQPESCGVSQIKNSFDDAMKEWIKLLQKRMTGGNKNKPNFSNTVMVELEAIADIVGVEKTLSTLVSSGLFVK